MSRPRQRCAVVVTGAATESEASCARGHPLPGLSQRPRLRRSPAPAGPRGRGHRRGGGRGGGGGRAGGGGGGGGAPAPPGGGFVAPRGGGGPLGGGFLLPGFQDAH